MRRAGLARGLVLAACAAALAQPADADAHTELTGTRPQDGARLRAAPRRVVAQYSEPLAAVVATTAAVDGHSIAGAATGRLSPTDAGRLEIPLPAGGSGRFVVTWRVTSADGHPLGGEIAFTVARPSLRATLIRVSGVIAGAVESLRAVGP